MSGISSSSKSNLQWIKTKLDHLNYENKVCVFLQVQLKNQKFNKLMQYQFAPYSSKNSKT